MMLRVYFPSIHSKDKSRHILDHQPPQFFSKKGATSAKHNTLQTYETTVPAESENSRHVCHSWQKQTIKHNQVMKAHNK